MSSHHGILISPVGFRATATLGVAICGVVFLTPFAVNNFIQGRPLLGVGSLAIVILCGVIAWTTGRGHYRPWLSLAGLAPAIVFFLALSLHTQGIIGALWCYPAIIAFYFLLPQRMAWLANGVLLAVAVPQAWLVLETPIAIRVAVTLLVVSAFAAIFIAVISAQHGQLQELAVTDSLTGLSNRTLLGAALVQAAEQSRRATVAMTLVALDLDDFKTINDTLGHDAGDAVLRQVGDLLKKRLRRSDQGFRLGGEEFLVLLYGADVENGRSFAEELRRGLADLEVLSDRAVTASFGVAGLAPDDDWKAWMKRADENLYRAKEAGRNQVVA